MDNALTFYLSILLTTATANHANRLRYQAMYIDIRVEKTSLLSGLPIQGEA